MNTESTSVNFFYQLISTQVMFLLFFLALLNLLKKTGAIHFHPENLPGLQSRLSAAEAEAGPGPGFPEMVPWCQNRCIVDASICRYIIYLDII